MAYSHQWRRAPELERERFLKLVDDVKLIFEKAQEMGVRLAGPTGLGRPELSGSMIAFNGSATCGHRFFDFGDPHPTDEATGVFQDDAVAEVPYWSGEYLTTRACHGGSCASDPFVLDRVFLSLHWTRLEHGGYFCKCATGFKPYDLVVTAVLIRLKEHFAEEVFVSSDGKDRAFEDAKRLCRQLFGWPTHFEIEPIESEVV